MATTAPPIPVAAPRVLLFGHPGSGKSSLLGALLRASDTQPDTLESEVEDPQRSLDHIRDSVYGGGTFQQVRAEVIRHVIEVHPIADEGEPVPQPFQVVMLDCDGSAAGSLLKHPDSIYQRAKHGTLAQAVVESDAMLLAVNAGEDDDELLRHFEDFQLFLERFHGRKARAYEVGGFPIFLVLTQCDRLSDETDTKSTWQKSVAENLEYVLGKFADFLEDADEEAGIQSPYLPFGSVDLRGYAVAVHRPELADDPDPPAEPYGVAELFRDCIAAARDHRRRVLLSDRRLWWTVRSVLTAVLFMLLGLGAMLAYQPAPDDSGLLERVAYYQRNDPPAAERLSVRNIHRNEDVLRTFRSDGGYERLPVELREFVAIRLEEIEAYRKYRKTLFDPNLVLPAEARNLEELDHAVARLTTNLAPPANYTWAATEAAAVRDKWLADAVLIRRAEEGWANWYYGLTNAANERARTESFDRSWRAVVAETLSADQPTVRDILVNSRDTSLVRLSDPIPGSVAVPYAPKPRGDPVTFQVPHAFDRVYVANQGWAAARAKLTRLRNLADLLALTPEAPSEGPGRTLFGLFVVPTPDANPNSTTLPGERLALLNEVFGPIGDPVGEWSLNQFDDPARSKLAERVERSFQHGTAHVRKLIEAELGRPVSAATPADWSRVAQSLETKPAFRDWGRFLHVLARLRTASAPNPVAELAAFLKQPRFELTLTGFEVLVPVVFQPRGKAVEVTGSFTVTSGASTVKFKLASQDERGTAKVYKFVPEGNGKLEYHPAEEMIAVLHVSVGENAPAELQWAKGGPVAFQFERLRTPPEPTLIQSGLDPRSAPGVKLALAPDTSVPPFPALFPYP